MFVSFSIVTKFSEESITKVEALYHQHVPGILVLLDLLRLMKAYVMLWDQVVCPIASFVFLHKLHPSSSHLKCQLLHVSSRVLAALDQ